MIRRLSFVGLLTLLTLTSTGFSLAQAKKDEPKKADPAAKKDDPPKKPEMKDEKKDDAKKDEMKKDDKKDDPTIEDASFKSADGVRLIGKLYKSSSGAAPVVMLLHDYKTNPDEKALHELSLKLQANKLNVFRFDFRGHGKSVDIVPSEFWVRPENKNNITLGGLNPAAKNTINYKEFKSNYFPMLVQDLAAARNALDQFNDTGVVNTSTIYLVGSGDMATLGTLFLTSEWSRERIKPNTAVAPQFVSIKRPLFPGSEPAGEDYGGAIWLSPTRPTTVPQETINQWCLNPVTVNMRNSTGMLLIHGDKDTKSGAFAKLFFDKSLMINAKNGPQGQKLTKPNFAFIRDIKGSANVGAGLLGNNLGTEKMIEDFLSAVEKDRRNKTRKNRDWDKPLWINVTDYGVLRP
ncbi:MAG: alpha/beta hydrolase [Fimbriiglobus sp.]